MKFIHICSKKFKKIYFLFIPIAITQVFLFFLQFLWSNHFNTLQLFSSMVTLVSLTPAVLGGLFYSLHKTQVSRQKLCPEYKISIVAPPELYNRHGESWFALPKNHANFFKHPPNFKNGIYQNPLKWVEGMAVYLYLIKITHPHKPREGVQLQFQDKYRGGPYLKSPTIR